MCIKSKSDEKNKDSILKTVTHYGAFYFIYQDEEFIAKNIKQRMMDYEHKDKCVFITTQTVCDFDKSRKVVWLCSKLEFGINPFKN